MINSLYSGFGTGICTEKTGVHAAQSRNWFRCRARTTRTPSRRASGRCIRLTPALAIRDGRCTMSFGVMGADFQPMGHAHVITNMVDYGMDIQQAIDAPRVFYVDEVTEVERGVPEASVAGLKSRGHNVVLRPLPHGGGQAHRHRLGDGQPDRRLRPAQGRLRDRLLDRQLRITTRMLTPHTVGLGYDFCNENCNRIATSLASRASDQRPWHRSMAS